MLQNKFLRANKCILILFYLSSNFLLDDRANLVTSSSKLNSKSLYVCNRARPDGRCDVIDDLLYVVTRLMTLKERSALAVDTERVSNVTRHTDILM